MAFINFRTLVMGFAIALMSTRAVAEIIYLKDGSKIEGTLSKTDDGWTVQTADKRVQLLAKDVQSIELNPATNPSAKVASEHLASLRRSVEGLTDLNEIIARFQRFVAQNADPVATGEAKKDLAMWQDRQKQKMVKAGTKWVTPADREKLIAQAGASAETARQLMKQNRTKEAEPLLVEVMAVDPTNATALYLIGLLRYQQEQLPAARKAFDATAAIIPNHPPTLNNLGVVQWRQHQYIPGLQNFDAAMLAAPVDKVILDNVAVALQTLPVELQKSQVTARVIRHFNEQDQKLAEQMAHEGMHRFGSLWVSDHDMEQIKQQEKEIQNKLDLMAGDFDRAKAHVDQLNTDISDDQAQMRRIEAGSFVTDPTSGARLAVPYPSSYYDLQHDLQKATRERDTELTRLDALKKQATDLQNSRPSVKTQGVMELIGAEGTPIKIAGAPQPAAAK